MNFDNLTDTEASELAAALVRRLRAWLANEEVLIMGLIGQVQASGDAYGGREDDLRAALNQHLLPRRGPLAAVPPDENGLEVAAALVDAYLRETEPLLRIDVAALRADMTARRRVAASYQALQNWNTGVTTTLAHSRALRMRHRNGLVALAGLTTPPVLAAPTAPAFKPPDPAISAFDDLKKYLVDARKIVDNLLRTDAPLPSEQVLRETVKNLRVIDENLLPRPGTKGADVPLAVFQAIEADGLSSALIDDLIAVKGNEQLENFSLP